MKHHLAQAVLQVGRLMYERQYIVATEGNISVRLNDDHILATPSGLCKGLLDESDLVVIDTSGRVVRGHRRVSSEIKMHLAVYAERPDVRAVVHAHPPYAVACMLAGISFDHPVLAEQVVFMGRVPVAPYARPSTEAVPESICPFIRQTDFVLLDHHGSLTVGTTVWDAYYKLEMLENAARMYYLASRQGPVRELPPEEVPELLKLREEVYRVQGRIIPFETGRK